MSEPTMIKTDIASIVPYSRNSGHKGYVIDTCPLYTGRTLTEDGMMAILALYTALLKGETNEQTESAEPTEKDVVCKNESDYASICIDYRDLSRKFKGLEREYAELKKVTEKMYTLDEVAEMLGKTYVYPCYALHDRCRLSGHDCKPTIAECWKYAIEQGWLKGENG